MPVVQTCYHSEFCKNSGAKQDLLGQIYSGKLDKHVTRIRNFPDFRGTGIAGLRQNLTFVANTRVLARPNPEPELYQLDSPGAWIAFMIAHGYSFQDT
jgi:hypothetical protein